MPDIDFFAFFRFWLATIVTIYASIVTLQSFRNWTSWLAGDDKYSSLLRRYLLVHGLRLRFKSFWGDVLICGLLCIAFFIIWYSQILRSEEHTSELQSQSNLVCRLLLEKKKRKAYHPSTIPRIILRYRSRELVAQCSY